MIVDIDHATGEVREGGLLLPPDEAAKHLARVLLTVQQRADQYARAVTALLRCRHGAKRGDRCAGCPGGTSVGGPCAGQVVGYGEDGRALMVPDTGWPSALEVSHWWRDSVDTGVGGV